MPHRRVISVPISRLRRLLIVGALVVGCSSAPPAPTADSAAATAETPQAPIPTASPTPTPSPSPTAAPTQAPSPTPSPTATATADQAGADVIERFLTAFAAEQPPFHVDSDVQVRVESGGESIEFDIATGGDVSGEDFAGEVTTTAFGRAEVTVGVIIVGGVAYTRVGDAEWEETEEFAQTQPLNPFALLRAGDLTYVGPVTSQGRELHHLRTETWIGGTIDDAMIPNAELEIEGSQFDIFVAEDGLPVEAQLEFAVSGTAEGDEIRLSYLVDYRFSNIGRPVTIEPPTD